MTYIVKTKNLSKQMHKQTIISEVNMHVSQGEIYGLVGPNGAGKTSLFQLLTGLWKPSQGEIEIFGERITNNSYLYLQQIGSMIGDPIFYENRTGLENLQMHFDYMGFYDQQLITETIDRVGIQDQVQKPVRTYSAGVKQRLGLIRAIALKPKLLILDEPSNGMDPVGIKTLRQTIQKLNQQYDMTVIISSHHMEELEQLADTIGVLNDGKLIEEVSVHNIKENLSRYTELKIDSCSQVAHLLENELQLSDYRVISDSSIRIDTSTIPIHQIVKMLVTHDIAIHEIKQTQDTLEDYILQSYKG
ncbi:ABC-2 type transport system ATP-binding protein [Gracilibacillus orientalis]|uniref:ABC-2 type transport system ATP-binding protein n=1 Tax=Gracilibacillus orientalis TaxID=334253 RepID=A0A1I4NAI4_9BACI|nr:ABC transporter ATP-binding protein [Gracilibacillus orientalis]SFM12290.1 ABC-2 type transport system ATP-binding protein [Gracilibacillus orientalis]